MWFDGRSSDRQGATIDEQPPPSWSADALVSAIYCHSSASFVARVRSDVARRMLLACTERGAHSPRRSDRNGAGWMGCKLMTRHGKLGVNIGRTVAVLILAQSIFGGYLPNFVLLGPAIAPPGFLT